MTRQKSNRTLLIEQERAVRKEERERKRAEKERDRSIRKERRDRKIAEREAKREERLKKQLAHESVKRNGVPKVKEGAQYFGVRDAIEVNPLMFCENCGHVVRESEMVGDICSICYNANEGRVNDEMNESDREGKGLPDTNRERELKTKSPGGQLTLLI